MDGTGDIISARVQHFLRCVVFWSSPLGDQHHGWVNGVGTNMFVYLRVLYIRIIVSYTNGSAYVYGIIVESRHYAGVSTATELLLIYTHSPRQVIFRTRCTPTQRWCNSWGGVTGCPDQASALLKCKDAASVCVTHMSQACIAISYFRFKRVKHNYI